MVFLNFQSTDEHAQLFLPVRPNTERWTHINTSILLRHGFSNSIMMVWWSANREIEESAFNSLEEYSPHHLVLASAQCEFNSSHHKKRLQSKKNEQTLKSKQLAYNSPHILPRVSRKRIRFVYSETTEITLPNSHYTFECMYKDNMQIERYNMQTSNY